MKVKTSLSVKILNQNFWNSILKKYNMNDYLIEKDNLNKKLLNLNGILCTKYKHQFVILFFKEIEKEFQYKYDKKIDFCDNLLFIKHTIERINTIINNDNLLDNLIEEICLKFNIDFNLIKNKETFSDINEVNNYLINENIQQEHNYSKSILKY